ncbi:MAG: serine/threonine-protein phosphatase [Candidatus Dormibacteraeota bacterium]|nr:serine/threonine-protein phosphatase [Candidatus Dormibacteraeota bacterium]MBV8445246.1 serine/threonine-protein phosphatase [Candidatus Dormibacteraeota bacterium]
MIAERSKGVAPEVRGIAAGGASDKGSVREHNEDLWGAVALGDGRLALVLADGMGGHVGGGEAADAAVSAALRSLDGAAAEGRARGTSGLLADAVARANAAVAGVRDNIGGNPGTTLVIAIVDRDSVSIANVGDSRAYLVHDSVAHRLTTDHTWVGEEVLAGRLPADSERHHPRRNLLSRAVLGDPVAADIGSHPWKRGDSVLLCSDGVWEPINDADLGRLAAGDAAADELAGAICEAALEAGSRDNVTAVVARRVR